MEKLNNLPEAPTQSPGQGRRSFLRHLGGVAVVGGLLASCSEKDFVNPGAGGARVGAAGDVVNLGTGDIGVINYAYALEQLEAAFYETVVSKFYSGISANERQILTDLRNHEVNHRAFFREALGSARIPDLTPDFSSIDFNDRNSVLGTARVFEVTGTGAYNGAGRLLMNPDYLLLAGKIVSVEARHASVIFDLQFPNTDAFAGPSIVDGNGLYVKYMPSQVLPLVQPFIKETIVGSGLPMA